MGNHRMFTLKVIDTDKFNDMPISARLLYYELGMRADDDGFVASPKKIVKMVGCSEDDLKTLIIKEFVICFESGIIVITHWNLHNKIRKDRKKDTLYQSERALLTLDEKETYSLCQPNCNQATPFCQSNGCEMTAQDKISKDKLSKENLINNTSTVVDPRITLDYQYIINSFNSICKSLPSVQKLTDKRRKQIKNADRLLNEVTFEQLFEIVENSDFLTGRNGIWNGCGFDWILNPSNLTKIIEGNYNNKNTPSPQQTTRNYEEEF